MKIGAVFPQLEIGTDPIAIRDYAVALEETGFDHLLAYDHVVGADITHRPDWNMPYTSEHDFHEPLMLFSFLAGQVSKLEFATGILILPQRQATLVGKQAANLDVFCGGRFRMGVGIGWNDVEYEALAVPFARRGARLDEQMKYLRRLWTEESFSYSGDFHNLTEGGLRPLPIQRPIPLWVGGVSDAAMTRAAKLGDGWMPVLPATAAPEKIDAFKGAVEKAGRDPARVGFENIIFVGATIGGKVRTWEDAVSEIEVWKKEGATHVCIHTMGAGLGGGEGHIEFLRKVKDAI